jgi:hypothetical protein
MNRFVSNIPSNKEERIIDGANTLIPVDTPLAIKIK